VRYAEEGENFAKLKLKEDKCFTNQKQ